MALNQEILKDIIRARLSRTIIYLRRFVKELPKHLIHLRHKFEHPLSSLQILVNQLSTPLRLDSLPSIPPPEGGIPEEVNYFDLALNEMKTALLYFKQRDNNGIFKEIQDYYLEQKLTKIIKDLEELEKSFP
ncbi:MAG: hypothetical protein HWN66_19870 [Candidatus Helarchaeota archaeon]|nr:hypothetical protein [Candidatus Helarchaeota archaeon]